MQQLVFVQIMTHWIYLLFLAELHKLEVLGHPTLASGTEYLILQLTKLEIITYTVVTHLQPRFSKFNSKTFLGPDAGVSGNVTFVLIMHHKIYFESLGGTPQVGGTWSPALASGTGVFNPL